MICYTRRFQDAFFLRFFFWQSIVPWNVSPIQYSSLRAIGSFSTTSIHLLSGLPLGVLPCDFHSNAVPTVSFPPRRILWPSTMLVTGACFIISYIPLSYLFRQFPVDALTVGPHIFLHTFFQRSSRLYFILVKEKPTECASKLFCWRNI